MADRPEFDGRTALVPRTPGHALFCNCHECHPDPSSIHDLYPSDPGRYARQLNAEMRSDLELANAEIDCLRHLLNRLGANEHWQPDVDMGIGIESGVFSTNSITFDVCACCIMIRSSGLLTPPHRTRIGFSSAWEVPQEVSRLIFYDHYDMDGAAFKAGLTTNKRLGAAEGLVGVITKGRLTRKSYTQQAIVMAMAHIESDLAPKGQ